MTASDGARTAYAHYRRGLGTALRHNQIAYAYSMTATTTFGALAALDGPPDVADCFLCLLGTGIAFAVASVTVTRGFKERLPREPSEVIALGSAFSVVSMGAGLGVACLLGWAFVSWVVWLLGPLAATVVYLSLAGAELAVAGYRHEAGGVGGEFDT
jgi:hypothetical protein